MELYRRDSRDAALKAFPQLAHQDVLLCLGRIDPIKNQGWLLEQAPVFLAKHPNTTLVLAGPCTDEGYGRLIENRIKELGLSTRVLLTGGLPAEDPRVAGLLQLARVLILPSLSETFGLVILEAWAARTTVISARASGPAALIEHGKNGWLFDLESPQSFHTALEWTLSNPKGARQMAERGATLAEGYSVSTLGGQLKSLYQQLIEEKQCVT